MLKIVIIIIINGNMIIDNDVIVCTLKYLYFYLTRPTFLLQYIQKLNILFILR
jgi:hypothetical protein